MLRLGREDRSWSKYLCFIIGHCIIIIYTVNSWAQHIHIRGTGKEWKVPSSFPWRDWKQSLEQPTLPSCDSEFGVCRITVPFLSKPEVGAGSPGNRFPVSVCILMWSFHWRFSKLVHGHYKFVLLSSWGRNIIFYRCGSEAQMWIL